MKTCKACGSAKSLDEFYKHPQMADGHFNQCKECYKAAVRARGTNTEYEKTRATLPHRVAARAEYAKSERGRKTASKAKRAWRMRNPKKYLATVAVSNAVRDGKLVKQDCEVCGKRKVHGHHDDYSNPLDVRWLCPAHHKAWHDENGEGLNG